MKTLSRDVARDAFTSTNGARLAQVATAQLPDIEHTLADFVAGPRTRDDATRLRARILLADAFVLSVAASEVSGLGSVLELGAGTGEHLSWATGRRLGAADAVQANSTAINARFQDDTDMSTWSHPGSFVIPGAVAAVVERDGTLGDLIDALIAGYAATVWLGGQGEVAHAMKQRGFRPSPVFGPLGAAAAVSRGLGLDAEATRHALNAAALVGRGTLRSVGGGGDDWRLHAPGAARDGFLIALAAQRGMRAAELGLTGSHGFLDVITGDRQAPGSWSEAPRDELINEVWQKALPIVGDDMSVALAAQHLHGQIGTGQITGIRVHMNADYAAFPGTQVRPPYRSVTAAQASVRFSTAHLLRHGRLSMRDLETERNDSATARLAEMADVIADPSIDYTDALVEVDVAGRTYRCRTTDLPKTLFWRDESTQMAVADELLGARGRTLVSGVTEASEATKVGALLETLFGYA